MLYAYAVLSCPGAAADKAAANKSSKYCDLAGTHLFLLVAIETVATRCHILKLKCTKLDFGWGSAQNPLGELTALPQSP